MRTLVFVHGRGQQGREPDALRQRWAAGLNKGLTAAGRDAMDSAAIDAIRFPFYGDVLWAAVVQGRAAVPDVAALDAVQQVDPGLPDVVNRRQVAVLQAMAAELGAQPTWSRRRRSRFPARCCCAPCWNGWPPFRGRRGRDLRLVARRCRLPGAARQRSWETPEGEKRSVTELEAEEVGASLKWATAKVERATQRGNGDAAPVGSGRPSVAATSTTHRRFEQSLGRPQCPRLRPGARPLTGRPAHRSTTVAVNLALKAGAEVLLAVAAQRMVDLTDGAAALRPGPTAVPGLTMVGRHETSV